jgi:hypothetical protein
MDVRKSGSRGALPGAEAPVQWIGAIGPRKRSTRCCSGPFAGAYVAATAVTACVDRVDGDSY